MKEIKLRVNNLLNYSEAAKILGVSRQTIHTWIKQGKLKLVAVADRRYLLREDVEKLAKIRKKGG